MDVLGAARPTRVRPPVHKMMKGGFSVKKRLLPFLLALAMVFSLAVPAFAAAPEARDLPTVAEDDVVILYTNDVHTYIDQDLTYSMVAGYKDTLDNVLLVDAGDHIQGTAYGSMDDGATIIELMNASGYDLATLGNHEFDYGMEGTMNAIAWADFPYVSCNFYHEENGVKGDNVLDSYEVFEVNGVKIAIIGITTPESFTKSTPAYFQDDEGNYIYGIAGGSDGEELYSAVQEAIDAASEEADYVIALGHLGVDPSSTPWTSEEVIANTTGLDAFIDGHSHTTMEMETVLDEEDNPVVLTQTGSYLDAMGQLTISADGTITTQLLTAEDLAEVTPNAEVLAIEEEWIAEIDAELGTVIGYTDNVLANHDSEGNRLVRKQETNTGDFVTDALYYLFDNMDMDVDAAIMNGGGIRNTAITNELSYQTCKEIHTFGNVACLITVTGQQILDALEWGAKDVAPAGETAVENGGFLQVSGLRYTINTAIPSTVQQDDKGVWTGGPTGEYRVTNVEILNNETGEYEPLDLTASYNLAGYNYTLRDLGDGFAMFDGAVNVLDYVMEDYMVLANYIQSFPANEDGLPEVTGYEEVDNRITIVNEPVLYTDVTEDDWFYDAVEFVTEAGYMDGVAEGIFDPEGTATRGMLMTVLARFHGETLETTDPWYQAGMDWAMEAGVSDGTRPTENVTREEVVTMMWRLLGEPQADADLSAHPDADEISDWAMEAVEWAVSSDLMEGSDGNMLNPGNPATRAEIAQLMVRFSNLVEG